MRSKSFARARREEFEDLSHLTESNDSSQHIYRSEELDEAFVLTESNDGAFETPVSNAFLTETILNAQSLLEVSEPEDEAEREAERIAEEVMQTSAAANGSPSTLDDEDDPFSRANGINDNLLPSATVPSRSVDLPGQPLPDSTRELFELRLHRDFSDVKVHQGTEASKAASLLNAKAFTVGNEIVFGEGYWAPESSAGQRLLAHELAHVGQQTNFNYSALTSKASRSVPLITDGPHVKRSSLGDSPTIQERIVEAIQNRDPGLIKSINSYESATDLQLIEMIRIVLDTGWIGPRDEYALERLWGTWEDQVVQKAEEHIEEWLRSAEGGAELGELWPIRRIKEKFAVDVWKTAHYNLDQNFVLGQEALAELGISPADWQTEPTEEQKNRLQNLKDVALQMARALESQRSLRQIQVGWRFVASSHDLGSYYTPEFFNPKKEPESDLDEVSMQPHADAKSWEVVNEKWQTIESIIKIVSENYPVIFALIRSGDVKEIADTDIAESQVIIAQTMKSIFRAIEKTRALISSGDLDFRELTPIHDLLIEGFVPVGGSKEPWGNALHKWAIMNAVGDYESAQAWNGMGYAAAGLGLAIASLATGGVGAIILGAAGASIGVIETAESFDRFKKLSTAEDTALSEKFQLVKDGQVEAAKLEAIINAVMAGIDVLSFAGDIAKLGKATRSTTDSGTMTKPLIHHETEKLADNKLVKTGAQETADETTGTAKRRSVFGTKTATENPDAPPGFGSSDKYGNYWYSTAGSQIEQDLAKFHEQVHSILSPKLMLLRDFRADFSMSLYQNSPLFKYLEEALAETVAQLRVNGIRSLPVGIKFPIDNGYVELNRAFIKETLIGTIIVGSYTYGVYLIASRD